ncbi:DUF6653 family protein [Jannaschia rubra]|uniref:Transmembrane protein n=1 Tax=Jannaschia rubra TaxID=282197 RepID=A0A0M6XSC6_9RHOB|nr:DUF6653 family protein [Jannaschia rubra]CTQ33562.1 hypothetical protein JAN5088_02344 [Jannaschia rubra]SFG03919.1 hypothetical protein SAMN04488517_102391 [Jannaschia rubra]
MDVFRGAERLMAMDDAAWARHGNPRSVATRFTVLPLIALAIWSRVWLGWWALVPLAGALGWNWLNPRLFSAEYDPDNWATRAVEGERIFLRHRADIAPRHRRMAVWLSMGSLPGLAVMGWGLWALWWDWAVFGVALAILPKLWFCDRMVWIHADWTKGRAT